MAIIDPIYSIENERDVYHTNSDCTERNNIEARNVRAGTGDKRLCEHCKKLNRMEFFIALKRKGGNGLLGGLTG